MKQLQFLSAFAFSFCMLMLASTESWSQENVTFDYTGAGQAFTVPNGVSSVTVHVWGAGGGGGRHRGGGGGGGAYETAVLTVAGGNVINITVGEGGAGGVVGTEHGSAGEPSIVKLGSTTITAQGGTGGMSFHQTAGTGGKGKFNGADGLLVKYPDIRGGYGGGAGGSSASANGQTGGSGTFPGGNGGNRAGEKQAFNGTVPGGGGGGGGNNATFSGNGGHGRVIISYTKPEITGENLAQGKTARQSSTAYSQGAASNAADGVTNGTWSWNNNSVTHTNGENNPWWEVDLGSVYDISGMKIWNRTDACCWNRLQNFYVMVSENPITANSTTTMQYVAGPLNFSSGQEASMLLKNNARGRYVRIFIEGANKFLSLAEVEVFGAKPAVKISEGKTARQSSTAYSQGAASNAADGVTNGTWSWNNNSVTHTNGENNPWWEVDLGSVYDISEIKIWNRTDACCWNRLQNFYVMVSENPITANSTTTMQYVAGPLNFSSGQEASKSLKNNARGRYVRIFIEGANKILSLAEVEVFGSGGNSLVIPSNPDPIDEGVWFVIQNKSDVDSDFNTPARRMALKTNGSGALVMAAIPLSGNFDEFLWRTIKVGNEYKLINKKMGEAMAMDCCSSTPQSPIMANLGNYSGQNWFLEPSNIAQHGTNVYTMSNGAITKSKALQFADGTVTVTNKNAGDTRQCWVFQPIGLVDGYQIPVTASHGFDRSLSLPFGYQVVASNTVSDWALLNAHLIYKNILNALLNNHVQVVKSNNTNKKTVVMISKDDPNEVSPNTPYIYGTFDTEWVKNYRGGAGGNGITLITEEMMNKVGVYHRGNADQAYREFEQVVHEFAHAIDFICNLNTSANPQAGGSPEWFAWKVQFWFNSGHSAGANLSRNRLQEAERNYVGTVFNPANTWLPPRWLRDR